MRLLRVVCIRHFEEMVEADVESRSLAQVVNIVRMPSSGGGKVRD